MIVKVGAVRYDYNMVGNRSMADKCSFYSHIHCLQVGGLPGPYG
jgi:hypothetical protein